MYVTNILRMTYYVFAFISHTYQCNDKVVDMKVHNHVPTLYFHCRHRWMCQPSLSTWWHLHWPSEQLHVHLCQWLWGCYL